MNHDTSSDTAPEHTQNETSLIKKPWYQRKRIILPLLIATPVVAAGFWFSTVFSKSNISGNASPVDIAQPDAWVHSQNLSELPRDLLTVPLIKDVLTEDFLYFYDTDEDWLSLKGSMRRISFEHELKWQDNLLQSMAQSPADIYLWRDSSSALRYWAIGVERKDLTAVAQQLAQIKLNADKQLSQIGTVKVDGDVVPVLQMKLSTRRTMVLAAHANRMALISDVAMLGDGKGELSGAAEKMLKQILSSNVKDQRAIASDLVSSDNENSTQSSALSNRFFAQGYGAIMPHVQGLRFDYDGSAWRSQARLAPETSQPDAQIWQQVPNNAAWCVATTIDWAQVQKSLDGVDALTQKPNLSAVFQPTGAACWYADASSSVTQPLLIGQLNAPSDKNPASAQALNELFNWAVSTNKTYLTDVRKAARALRKAQNQLSALESEQKSLEKEAKIFNQNAWAQRKKIHKADMADFEKQMAQEESNASAELLPQIKQRNQETLKYYESELESINKEPDEYAKGYKEDLAKNASKQSETRALVAKLSDALKSEQARAREQSGPSFALNSKSLNGMTVLSRTLPITERTNPAMAFATAGSGAVYFSLDAALVERGVAVSAKTHPNLFESVPAMQVAGQIPYFYFNPSKFSTAFMQEGHKALPIKSKGKLRSAFDYHMGSRMSALSAHGEMTATMNQSDKSGWQILNWQK